MKMVKRIWNIISTILVGVMVLCAVFLMGSRLVGYQVFSVISGSMTPKYNVGDLLYVKTVNPNSVQVGDDITFVLNEELVVATHRVVRIDGEKQYFYTKGIANEIEDSDPVHFNNLIGVPQFSIPKLGYVSNFVQNPPGTYIALGVGLVLILLVFVPDIIILCKNGKQETREQGVKDDIDAFAVENQQLAEEIEKLKAQMAEPQKE